MKRKTTLTIVGMLFLFGMLVADTSVSTAANLQLFPKVTHPDGGGYIFAWVSNKDHQDFEIYTRAFDSNLSNGSSEIDISTPDPADGHRLHAEIVTSIKDTDKGAMVAWVDHYTQKVYALRVEQDGDIDGYFNSDGTPLEVHPAAFMTPPQMCSDGAGGAIFVWVEKSGSNYILKAKKITSSGGDGWNPATQDIATSAHTIRDPKIVSEGSYAYLMWVDYRDPRTWEEEGEQKEKYDLSSLYVQKIAVSDGSKQWGENDKHFYKPQYQTSPIKGFNFVVNEAGGITAVWREWHYKNQYTRIKAGSCNSSGSDTVDIDIQIVNTDEEPKFIPGLGVPDLIPRYSSGTSKGCILCWDQRVYEGSIKDEPDPRDIYYAVLSHDGSSVGDTVKVNTSGAYMINAGPMIVEDANHNGIIVWHSGWMRQTVAKILTRKLTVSNWSFSNQVEVSNTSSYAGAFDVIQDGSSGAVVVWGCNPGGDWDIYANKITSF